MLNVKDIQKSSRGKIRNFLKVKLSLKLIIQKRKKNCSVYDNKGNNDTVEIEIGSSSRMERVKTTMHGTYCDEKKMFAEIRWAVKQVLCGNSDNSCEGTINLLRLCFLIAKLH